MIWARVVRGWLRLACLLVSAAPALAKKKVVEPPAPPGARGFLWPRLSPDTVYRRFHAPLHRLPADAELSPRDPDVPVWDSLSEAEKLRERNGELFAALAAAEEREKLRREVETLRSSLGAGVVNDLVVCESQATLLGSLTSRVAGRAVGTLAPLFS